MPQRPAPAAPVPLALWPCAQTDTPGHPQPDPAGLTLPLAQRLLTEYTAPGDLVIDAAMAADPEHSPLHQAATSLHRRLVAFHAYEVPATPPAHGTARLLVAAGVRTSDAMVTPSRLVVQATRWLLAPGGLLAVVVPRTSANVDLVSRTVGLAAEAGLGYLQHVIALLVPIRHSQLALPATATKPSHRRTLPIHADVLVFATTTTQEATGA